MRRAVLALTFVVGLVAPAATGAQDNSAALSEVQQVLDTRAAAIKSGDRAAFLATIDPRARSDFRAAQAQHFDGLRSVPLEKYELRARLEEWGDLSAAVGDKYGGRAFLPETQQIYRLAGYDDRDAVDTLWLTFVQRDGRWFVTSDTDLEALGLDTLRNIWDLGDVRVRPTAHFLVISHPAQADRADALAALADEAMAAVTQRWTRPWSRKMPLILPASTAELEVLLQATFDLTNFVAFVTRGFVRGDDGFEPVAPRLYIQDENLSSHGQEFQLETLTHELVHGAAIGLDGPMIPAWVHEGVADWVATGQSTTERKPSGSDGKLARDHELLTGSAASIVRSYREARSAMSFLASTKGRDAPAALLAAIGSARLHAGNVDYHVDAALQRVAGRPYADFERAWAAR